MSDCIKTRQGIQKYVGRVKESGRIERRHSSFHIGLYGHTWVNFKDFCIELVTELMRLNPNKRCSAAKGGFPHERLHQDNESIINEV